MRLKLFYSVILILGVILLAACGEAVSSPTPTTAGAAPEGEATPGETTPAEEGARSLTVMTHDSFAVSEPVIRQFEEENNVKLNIVQAGDAGASLNRAILSKGSPLADVFYGVDNTFLSRALEADIFEPYDSPELANIPEAFQLDSENRALPVDFGDVCINYDKSYFEENDLAVPQTLEDLTKPEYRGLLVVESPATSSPGLAFMLATIAHFGEDGYLQYWEDLRNNGVVVVNDWETAYYTNFSGSSGAGPQPMVVSYGSSPVAEVVFAEQPLDEAPTGSIIGPDTCFRQIEFVGILQGTQQRELAEKFVDFMLSETFQEDMPLQMFVFPVNQNAKLPEPFTQFAEISEQPATLDPGQIASNREKWIQSWNDTVLR
ncbi:MAG: thiamine ABC transporter substrate-binding protein [Chloroflexi bacterium]|nr:thiamine ABC transporter substrate-binding protein [Chloroflexota bacterium]